MTPEQIAWHAQWRAASGHPGGWRVTRQFFAPLPDPRFEELNDRRGRVILFRSQAAAQRRADTLNQRKNSP